MVHSSIILQAGSITPITIYDWGPDIALVAVGLFIAWWFWSWINPVERGLTLGMFAIVGRQPGTRFRKIFRGVLVDSTDTLLGAYVDTPFRRFLYEAIVNQLQSEPDKNARLKLSRTMDWIYSFPIKQFCRIVSVRTPDHKKHRLIQIYNVRKRIDGYASMASKPTWNWASGLLARGEITGTLWSVPDSIQRTWGFTKRKGRDIKWHFFCPDDFEVQDKSLQPPYVAFAEAIAAAQPFARTYGEVKILNKRVAQAEKGRNMALLERAAQATVNDSTLTLLKGLGIEGRYSLGQTKRFTMNDGMMMIAGAAGGGGLLYYLRPTDPMMIILGCVVGLGMVIAFLGGR